MQTALELFLSFLKIGLLSFGGAYSFLPLIEREIVTNHQWLTHKEFLDVLAMVEIFPGAISIKFSSYVGYKVLGIPGIIIANVANFLPPALLITGLAALYTKHGKNPAVRMVFDVIRYAVLGMILAVFFKYVGKSSPDVLGIIILIASFAVMYFLNVHPAYIVLGAAVAGLALTFFPSTF